MPKSSKRQAETPTKDSPEGNEEWLHSSRSLSQLPAASQASARRRGERGSQKKPTKALVSFRLSPDVLTALRATGPGWQSRVNEVLRVQFVATTPLETAAKALPAKAGKRFAATA